MRQAVDKTISRGHTGLDRVYFRIPAAEERADESGFSFWVYTHPLRLPGIQPASSNITPDSLTSHLLPFPLRLGCPLDTIHGKHEHYHIERQREATKAIQ